jgi:hypothetical protein
LEYENTLFIEESIRNLSRFVGEWKSSLFDVGIIVKNNTKIELKGNYILAS